MTRLAFLLVAPLLLLATTSAAQTEVETSFREATTLLEKGSFSDALLRMERISDEGFAHPDASFNRALAYLQRADSAQVVPGDLGQAVAGLREAVLLAEDEQAEQLVNTIRQAISRQRARKGRDPVVVSPPLGRAVSELVRPEVWGALALCSSLMLALALAVRQYVTTARRLAANVAAATSATLLVTFAALFSLSNYYRHSWQEAVIVVEHATLRDSEGKPLLTRALDTKSDEVPEGASVYVVSHTGRLYEVEWGSTKAWLREGELRLLASP